MRHSMTQLIVITYFHPAQGLWSHLISVSYRECFMFYFFIFYYILNALSLLAALTFHCKNAHYIILPRFAFIILLL